MLKRGITKKHNARLRSGEAVRATGNKDRNAAKETSETNVRCRQSKRCRCARNVTAKRAKYTKQSASMGFASRIKADPNSYHRTCLQIVLVAGLVHSEQNAISENIRAPRKFSQITCHES